MCQLHFEDSQFTFVGTKDRLNKSAVPTLFNIPNPPPLLTPIRPPPKARAEPPLKRTRVTGKQNKMMQTEDGFITGINGMYSIVLFAQ